MSERTLRSARMVAIKKVKMNEVLSLPRLETGSVVVEDYKQTWRSDTVMLQPAAPVRSEVGMCCIIFVGINFPSGRHECEYIDFILCLEGPYCENDKAPRVNNHL